ncbi:hypothetical protein BASA62_002818 [Batrachochytrium salamandrivorans]|nr:hypothetical protein BASA62_002818 [Batrachochytrium salamandrivorans]
MKPKTVSCDTSLTKIWKLCMPMKLEGILKNPKESIHAFADRYLHAMRLAKADPNLKHVQVTHFLTRLSDQVRKDVNLVKATRPENVDTVSGMCNTSDAISTYENQCKPGHEQCYLCTNLSTLPQDATKLVTTQTAVLSSPMQLLYQHGIRVHWFPTNRQTKMVSTTAYQEPEAESKDPTVEDFYELFSKRPSNHLSQSLSEQTGIDYNSAFLVPIIFESVQLSAYIDSGASHSSVPQTLLQQIPHRKVIPPVPNSKTSLGAKRRLYTQIG